MKAAILAGGFRTRISDETQLRLKPPVEIGGKPVIWHIMKIYSHHGINEFIICFGCYGRADRLRDPEGESRDTRSAQSRQRANLRLMSKFA